MGGTHHPLYASEILIRGKGTKLKSPPMAAEGADSNFFAIPVFWGWRSDRFPLSDVLTYICIGDQNTGYAWDQPFYGLF